MTDAETRLWSKLRFRQINNLPFYRQKIIENYIVDFFCSSAKLIIEVDGSQHLTPEGMENDRVRDLAMAKLGYRVLRFTDADVLNNIEGVIAVITQTMALKGKNPSWSPFSKGRDSTAPLQFRCIE